MCNHYRNIPDHIQTWAEYVGWDRPVALPEQVETDIWPRREALIVRQADGQTVADVMRWGVPLQLPGKRPGTTITKYVTNVRNLASPFWRSMLRQPEQRCLVPFTSFAEPKADAGREEIWFGVAASPVAAFAGIWTSTQVGNLFAFLTCEPNPLVAPVHPKAMPVILQPEDYGRWLSGEAAEKLAAPFPSQLMTIV